MWTPTPSLAEFLYYIGGHQLDVEYTGGSNAWGAWFGPSRIILRPFDRVLEAFGPETAARVRLIVAACRPNADHRSYSQPAIDLGGFD